MTKITLKYNSSYHLNMAKRKMIDMDDLLDQQPDPTSSDMIFIAATQKTEPSKSEIVYLNRLDRIRSTAVNVDEPLFDGEIDLDLGHVKINSEHDIQQIKKELLEQENITNSSNDQRDNIVKDMRGIKPEDVVEDLNIDVPTVPTEQIDRKQIKRANSRAVQEILDDLMRG